jgi:hypothetical protein
LWDLGQKTGIHLFASALPRKLKENYQSDIILKQGKNKEKTDINSTLFSNSFVNRKNLFEKFLGIL